MNFPQPLRLKQFASITTTTSAVVDFPVGYPAYDIVMVAAGGTGTSPTLDALVSFMYDGAAGSLAVGGIRFVQVTGSASSQRGSFQNGLAIGGSAVNPAALLAGTGGTSALNIAVTRNCKITLTVGGTNPAFATCDFWVMPVCVRHITY